MEIAIPLLVVLIPLAYQAWTYVDQRKRELRDKRFETFHKLIRDLVEPSEGKAMYIDRQIAVVFELRNFPEYAEVTKRILEGLRQTWSKNPDKNSRLLTEIELTLASLPKGKKAKTA
jgi:hypothetical protein